MSLIRTALHLSAKLNYLRSQRHKRAVSPVPLLYSIVFRKAGHEVSSLHLPSPLLFQVSVRTRRAEGQSPFLCAWLRYCADSIGPQTRVIVRETQFVRLTFLFSILFTKHSLLFEDNNKEVNEGQYYFNLAFQEMFWCYTLLQFPFPPTVRIDRWRRESSITGPNFSGVKTCRRMR